MADPRALDGMQWDDRQLLKEAVCDAILERTRRVVSGDGVLGSVILGERPARTLSSGFILPRLNEDGDDESSDIKIPAHGMDLRVRPSGGVLSVQPNFSVYVRGLPTSAELFAREGRLIPRADFNDAARRHAKDQINQRAAEEIPRGTPSTERATRRAAISRDIYIAMGVGVPPAARLPGGDERDQANIDEGLPPPQVLGGRLRIPDQISRRYDIPQKWIRLSVDAPTLILSLPCDVDAWQESVADYKTQLLNAIRTAYVNWIASPAGQSEAWRKIRPPSEAFWEPGAWDRFLAAARAAAPRSSDLIPQFDTQILVQPLRESLEEGCFAVRIALENLREGDAAMECGLFNVSLTVELPNDALGPMRLERVKRSYHLAGFMTMPAIGVNGGVSDLGSTHAGIHRLRTTWMPRYVLPRSMATQIDTLPTAYQRLGLETTDLDDLTRLPQAMRDWIETIGRETQLSVPGEEGSVDDEAAQRTRFQDDLEAWRREATRINAGVALLVEAQQAWRQNSASPQGIPYRAWLLVNRTFSAATPPRNGEPPPGWRLFQLAFVLAHIPTLASRLPDYASHFDAAFDEDGASLLYMATGGGKTEAFFGTLVFALFLDRLRGKVRGVTAMMHYPLRLLTVQQAQRLARLLARAEIVRRTEDVRGSPFEIGFWVGGTNTPNSTEKRPGEMSDALRCVPVSTDPRARDEDALLASQEPIDREYVAAKSAWNKLPTCPFCGSDEGTGLRLFRERHHQLGIVCLNDYCDWNRIHHSVGQEPLPFLIADTDIYRRAPAVLLGTIDKLALLGQSITTVDRIAGMFGLARWIENVGPGLLHMPNGAPTSAAPPPGYRRVAPAYSDGDEIFFDPFPSLIVQDEMHLLEESLGTFGGIFETGLLAWLSRLSRLLGARVCRVPGAPDRPRLPHVIGATATAADAAKHTRALYQRHVIQFPHPGQSLHGGFYTRMAAFEGGEVAATRQNILGTPRDGEAAAPWGRVYASLMTNGRLHTVTTLSVLAAHAATITRWERDLASVDEMRRARAAAEIEDCVSDARWFELRRSAVRTAARDRRFDRLAAVVDLHRIELTYVTNKKGGDQILSALETEVREAHAAMGPEYSLSAFTMDLISGGVDIGGIQSVIRAAEEPFDPMRDNISAALRGIVATSAISHGVDVEAFNAMAFAGIPSDIAEYIQASSRVGRTHVGFSLLIPTPQTRRDRFVVEVHESFHRLLERMIAPPAVERWADRAIDRTIPSLLQMWLAGVRHQERFIAALLERKAEMALPTTVERVERLLRDRQCFDDCVSFIVEAVGIGAATGGPTNPVYYSDLVRAAAIQIQSTIGNGDFTGLLSDFWNNPLSGLQRPMMSLRDVDAAGQFRASQRTQRNQPLSWEEVGEAMAMVRNRGVSRRRGTASSELDGEA